MAMEQPRDLSWKKDMLRAIEDGRYIYPNPRIVGERDTLTPLQRFALELINSGDFRLFLNIARRAMLGPDNWRSNGGRGLLLFRKVNRLLQGNDSIPDTLTADLAKSRRRYTVQRGFNWLLRRALNGFTFEVHVSDGITFDMEPPRELYGPVYNDLLNFFEENNNGTKAEVMVLLSLGFTPNNMRTMVRFLKNLLGRNMEFLTHYMTGETVVGIRYHLNPLQVRERNPNRNQQGSVRRCRDGNRVGHYDNGHAQRRPRLS